MRVALWKSEISDDLVKALAKRGVEIVVLLGGRHDQIPCHSAYELFFGRDPEELPAGSAPPANLSDGFLDEYSRCVGRIGFNPITHANNFRGGGLVHPDAVMDWAQFHVQTARAIFAEHRPDQLWMANHPHMGFDNALVDVALQQGMEVVECGPVPIPGKFRFAKRTRDGGERIPEAGPFRRLDLTGFAPNLFYLRTVQRDVSETKRQAMGRSMRTAARQRSIRSLLAAMYESSVRRKKVLLPSLLELLDARQRSAAPVRFQRRYSAKRLRRKYANISDRKMLDAPFVYFPLHLEPEAAVSGVRNGFHNQVNAIQALRAAIPEHWAIRLKENPKQAHLHRDDAFYRRLAAMDKVGFVDDDSESGALIDASALVATITGTAGFEALRAGKACVYFGDPWYASLPGAFEFSSDLDFAGLAKLNIEAKALDDALAALSERLADGLVNHWMAEILPEDTSWSQLMDATAESLVRIARA